MNDFDSLISTIKQSKSRIKDAITAKRSEIDQDRHWNDISDDVTTYANAVRELYSKVNFYFEQMGYDGIPELIESTINEQILLNSDADESHLDNMLFCGKGMINYFSHQNLIKYAYVNTFDMSNNQMRFGYCRNLEVLILNNPTGESPLNPYHFCRNCPQIMEIRGIADVSNVTIMSNMTYFFTANAGNLMSSKLKVLKLKGIRRSYDFSTKPLDRESVEFMINNAIYADDYEGNYTLSLSEKSKSYFSEGELAELVAAKNEEGVNIEIA